MNSIRFRFPLILVVFTLNVILVTSFAFHHSALFTPITRNSDMKRYSTPDFPESSTPIIIGSKPLIRSKEWAALRGIEPGFGGIWQGDPNAPKFNVTFVIEGGKQASISLMVPNDRYIYHYFEEIGLELPVINRAKMCRQGCCTVCAAKVLEGKVKMDAPLGLLKDMREKNYALTCCSMPRSDIVCELQEEDYLYLKQWGEGFEGGGKTWGGFLPDDGE